MLVAEIQHLRQQVDSQVAAQAAFGVLVDSSSKTSYASYALPFTKTQAWRSAAPLPEPLPGLTPPIRQFLNALRSKLQGGLSADWVQQLSSLEKRARIEAKNKNRNKQEPAPGVGAVSYIDGEVGPTKYDGPGKEQFVHLAVGFVFRILAKEHLTTQCWRDSSRSGVTGFDQKTDYSSFTSLPLLCATLVRPCSRK